ncbi:RND transporter [Kosakonia radicincitans UMEnt01/12]|nr:RND transporter [Kosakonia radicincitans UMEnt01/12]
MSDKPHIHPEGRQQFQTETPYPGKPLLTRASNI